MEKIDNTTRQTKKKKLFVTFCCCCYYGYMARHQIEMNMIRLLLLCKCGCKFHVITGIFPAATRALIWIFCSWNTNFVIRRVNWIKIRMDVCVHRLSKIVNNHLIIQVVEFSDSIKWLSFSQVEKVAVSLFIWCHFHAAHTFKCSPLTERDRTQKMRNRRKWHRDVLVNTKIWQFSRQTSKYLIMFSIHFMQTARPFYCCVIKWACNLASNIINELYTPD